MYKGAWDAKLLERKIPTGGGSSKPSLVPLLLLEHNFGLGLVGLFELCFESGWCETLNATPDTPNKMSLHSFWAGIFI